MSKHFVGILVYLAFLLEAAFAANVQRIPNDIKVTTSTASSSPTTGSITTAGGLGVLDDVWIGDDLNVAGDASITGTITYPSLTASTLVGVNGSKQLYSLGVTTTEAGYLAGVTSTLCGINQSCTLTNKTLTTPVLTTPSIDVATFAEQGSTPATPSSGSGKVYFKNDGYLYQLNDNGTESRVGAGSGGGSGYNMLQASNPDFEDGTTGWTASGGSFAADTSTPLFGSGSVTWDASAASQTLDSTAITVPSGLYARPCLVRVFYNGGDGNLALTAYDGTNTLASVTLATVTVPTPIAIPFQCPSSGSVRLRMSSTADAASVEIDRAHLGEDDRLFQLSQASLAGKAYYAVTTNCRWTRSGATTMGDFSTDTDCPGPTVEYQGVGSWQTTDANLPQFTINNLPPGTYLAVATGHGGPSTGGARTDYRLSDGTTNSGEGTGSTVLDESSQFTVWGYFSYTTAGDRTFKVQGATSNSANPVNIYNDLSSYSLQFHLLKFPSAAESSVRADDMNYRVDAYISGANPSLGTSNQSSYIGIENGSLTLTTNSGSATAWIPCSSTNDSTGTTCAAGNESVGIVFWIPRAGDYEVCAQFGDSWNAASGTLSGLDSVFQLVETPNAAQTISYESGGRVAGRRREVVSGGGDMSYGVTQHICGTFPFTSNGKKTVRLMYEQLIETGISAHTLLADAGGTTGQRNIHFSVKPINFHTAVPAFTGLVTSNGTSQYRTEFAYITNSGTPTITRQSGSWLSSVTDTATGRTGLNITAGIFSTGTEIGCSCVAINGGNRGKCHVSGATDADGFEVQTTSNTTDTLTDFTFSIVCTGVKG